MLSLDDLLAPITPAVFHADFDDRKPLHIPAAPGTPKQALLDWERFKALLEQHRLVDPKVRLSYSQLAGYSRL